MHRRHDYASCWTDRQIGRQAGVLQHVECRPTGLPYTPPLLPCRHICQCPTLQNRMFFSQVGFVIIHILYNRTWFVSQFCSMLSNSPRWLSGQVPAYHVKGDGSNPVSIIFFVFFLFFVTVALQVNYSFCIFVVGRLDQLNYFFSVFSMGWLGLVGLGFSIRVWVRVSVRGFNIRVSVMVQGQFLRLLTGKQMVAGEKTSYSIHSVGHQQKCGLQRAVWFCCTISGTVCAEQQQIGG